jgi:uncharacterized protein DUF3311
MSVDPARNPEDRPPVGPLPMGTKILAGVLLVIPMLALALVPTYSSTTPKLWGFPFFYWYQLLWVFLASGFTWTAYVVIRRARGEKR